MEENVQKLKKTQFSVRKEFNVHKIQKVVERVNKKASRG
jgi:hypothetical protein